MAEHAGKPKVRFAGFTETWEQRKLGEIVKIRRGLTYKPSDICENGIRVLRSSNIDGDSFVLNCDDVFVREQAVNIDYARENDILITAANGSSRLVGKHAILSQIPDKSTVHGGFMLLGSTEEPYFINASMGSSWYRRFVELFVAGGNGAIGNLNKNDLDNQDIFVPSKKEQTRIGTFFRQLDRLVTLHQRKRGRLENIKKAMLEKMFPKNGADVPEVRFAGFTEAWEQRKLVSLCEKFTDGDWIEAKDQSNSGVRLIQTGNVGLGEYIDKQNNKKWISKETFERLNCEEVFSGDILISRLPEPAGRACIVPNLGTKMITAVDCTIVRTATQVNPKYLLQYLSSQSYFDEVNTCLAGGTRQRISRSNLATFDVSMPVRYEEQKAIGEFLCGMDHLITLHQRKVALLQNIKKACLEKMFV